MSKRLVVLESPYRSRVEGQIKRNIRYARDCVRDCLARHEAPIASHLLYTQDGILNDDDPDERNRGIRAGLSWTKVADATVVYIDHGISEGMLLGIFEAQEHGVPVEFRRLYND